MVTLLAAVLCIFCVSLPGTTVGEVVAKTPDPIPLSPRIDFYPQELKSVMEDELRQVSFGITWGNFTEGESNVPRQDFLISVTSEHPSILEIVNASFPRCVRSRDLPRNFSFLVRGVFLGYTRVAVHLTPGCEGGAEVLEEGAFELTVSVTRVPTALVDVVTGIMAALVAFNYVNMGVQLDLDVIGKVLKRPVGPAIGFVCQFLFMPLASFGISLLLLEDVSLRLGLFVLGCSPGGSMSNFWTLLFDGDVNLSIAMTFISTVAALAMMPLWIFTLGASLFRDRQATIPYINLAGSLVVLTLPMGVGLLIRHRSPRLTRISRKIIRPFTIVCVLVGISVGLYANSFVFSLFTWRVLVSGVGIAWGGYCFGALTAWAFGLNRAQVVAVSIETAFQNPAVAFVLLLLSLPQPDADLSSVPVIAQLMLTGLPMWALLVGTRAWRWINNCCSDLKEEEDIEKPEIDTVQKAYWALETQPPLEDEERAELEVRMPKVDIVRFPKC